MTCLAITIHQTNPDFMLARRLRRWPNMKSALVECIVLAGWFDFSRVHQAVCWMILATSHHRLVNVYDCEPSLNLVCYLPGLTLAKVSVIYRKHKLWYFSKNARPHGWKEGWPKSLVVWLETRVIWFDCMKNCCFNLAFMRNIVICFLLHALNCRYFNVRPTSQTVI